MVLVLMRVYAPAHSSATILSPRVTCSAASDLGSHYASFLKRIVQLGQNLKFVKGNLTSYGQYLMRRPARQHRHTVINKANTYKLSAGHN